MSVRQWKAAVVQSEPCWFDKDKSLEKTLMLINEAADNGAALVAFPEVWIPGYPNYIWTGNFEQNKGLNRKYIKNSISAFGPEMMTIRELAAQRGIFVGLGFSELDKSSIYLSQILISDEGEVLMHRRKLKPTHVERTVYGDGSGDSLINVVETKLGRIGMLNCWEHLQPLLKFNTYSQGEQVHIASWPYDGEGGTFSLEASQMHAVEGGTFVLCTNQVISKEAFEDQTSHQTNPLGAYQNGVGGGKAMVFGPLGVPLTERQDELFDGLIYCDIDLDEIYFAKATADPVGHYSRPDLLRLVIDPEAKAVMVSTDKDSLKNSLHPKTVPLVKLHKRLQSSTE
ncbi:unnamed protein product [Kuraishia capsulata CBS 1993]|uniref:CN hydrolase domain-containing protein n=1 Tax=Kuraishia capsulata CBS 1993 TaxID=1382522 RepID=W6ML37_9ASCO|nr:uncharacterized protein KUCA_T00003133001 [Kuraishia capsulata CBS 1993]CDK27156.1 unnamed protein product [Kuraishia capsulata CBS 1993]